MIRPGVAAKQACEKTHKVQALQNHSHAARLIQRRRGAHVIKEKCPCEPINEFSVERYEVQDGLR
ncbi:MAG: hypothetical protein KVP17_002485 [Porospora cf. gigantea B]|uniref:uncharacterized protein n=1 Tax=Porospora cf. gigantea B TaxID=2853592 RepID=UPI003571EE2E|nr:MAG: hypothetical protein KVP17_002485 [Porospora cf. gigantea B]